MNSLQSEKNNTIQSMPLVSIITPVYNGKKYLEDLIQSVVAQDYPRIEHIIIDDGSTDGGATVEIIKRYPHIRWWSRPNKGAYPTMNEGLAAAKGEVVTLINADDKYANPTAVSTAMQIMMDDPLCDVVYGDTLEIDANGELYYLEGPVSAPLWLFRYLPVITHCSIFVKKKLIIENNLFFLESLVYLADADWLHRLLKPPHRIRRVRKSIAMFRFHPQQRGNDPISPARLAEIDYLRKTYPCNPLIEFFVYRWVTLVRMKNCYKRAGIAPLLREVKGWINRHIFRKK